MLFENKTDREVRTGYYLPKLEIKYYHFMIDRRDFFYQPANYNLKICDNIQKIAIGIGDDYNLLFTRLVIFQRIL